MQNNVQNITLFAHLSLLEHRLPLGDTEEPNKSGYIWG